LVVVEGRAAGFRGNLVLVAVIQLFFLGAIWVAEKAKSVKKLN
jgi:hypothetical protein